MSRNIQTDKRVRAKKAGRTAASQARIDRMNRSTNQKSREKYTRREAEGMVCAQCGEIRKPVTVTGGNLLIEIFLWCCFLLPGLLYSVWRLASRKKNCCPDCRIPSMVSVKSKVGRELTED